MKRNVVIFGPVPASAGVATTARARPTRSRLVKVTLLMAFVCGSIVDSSAPNAAASRRPEGELQSTSDAVLQWNANAGKAAIAACISPVQNPLHESRMYAMSISRSTMR